MDATEHTRKSNDSAVSILFLLHFRYMMMVNQHFLDDVKNIVTFVRLKRQQPNIITFFFITLSLNGIMWGTNSGSKSRFSSSPGSYSSSRSISYSAVSTSDNSTDEYCDEANGDGHDERQFMKLQVPLRTITCLLWLLSSYLLLTLMLSSDQRAR